MIAGKPTIKMAAKIQAAKSWVMVMITLLNVRLAPFRSPVALHSL